MMVLFWKDLPQFPPSVVKKKGKTKRKIPFNGFEASFENTKKSSPPNPKKPKSRKSSLIYSLKFLNQTFLYIFL